MNRTTLSPVIFLLATLATSSALAQSKLILPQNQNDIRQLTKPATSGPCLTCGVVTNVRSQQIEVGKKAPQATPGGEVLQGAPLIGSGTAVKDVRKSALATSWKVTVRYDNGQYAAFDQDDEPVVLKGDKVQVVEGRVEPR